MPSRHGHGKGPGHHQRHQRLDRGATTPFADLMRYTRSLFIVAKNPMNYRLAYGGMPKGMIVLDTPGPTQPNLRHVRFEKLKRPFFPADPDVPGMEPVVLG